MKTIICLAQSRWSGDPERTQHLMRMVEGANILYFELNTTSNFSKSALKRFHREARQPHPGVTVYRVPTVYFHEEGGTLPERWSINRAVNFILGRIKRHHVRDALLWCATPLLAEQIEKIPHKGLIYDCYRSWEKYPEQWESQLAYDADLVFAASENLREHVSPCNRNAFLLPYGVNYKLYAQGKEELPLDPAFEGLPRPIFGYLGNAQRGLHLAPVIKAARQHPDWSFVIIGRVRKGHPDLGELKKCKNIYCIGHRMPADVPHCLAACDVCIDLLHNDLADEDVIHERIYAYFAAEKPVACVYPKRYVPEYPDVIYGAQNSEEFDSACLRAANELGRRKRNLRGDYARQADWSNRAEVLNQVLRDNGML